MTFRTLPGDPEHPFETRYGSPEWQAWHSRNYPYVERKTVTENRYVPCVAICVPVRDKITSQFWVSYRNLWKPSSVSPEYGHQGCTHIFDTYTLPVVEARSYMTHEALRSEPRVTHLLFADDDMQFPPHALKRLLDHDLDIVGGLCHNRRPPYSPIIMKRHENGREGMGFMYAYPRGMVVECDATGAGFLLVKREVFEAVGEKFGEVEWWRQIRGISEDFSFCMRAKECGFKIHVDCGLDIGHVGDVVVDAAFAERNRPFQFERWSPAPEIKGGEEPVASVVIPTYNQDPKLLRAAVLSAVHQTVPVEVVVVDDGSDPPVPLDGWPEHVEVVRHIEAGSDPAKPQNRGISAALNTGVKVMSTEWFCWLSSDDLLDPRKVETQIAHLKAAGGKLSFHRYQVFQHGSEGFATYSQMPGWQNIRQQREVLAGGCAINGSTVMAHKSVFDEVGVFDTNFKYSGDWEWFCRAGAKYLWYGIDEILGSRRERPGVNLTAQIEADPSKKARRDVEDNAVRSRWLP